MNVVDQLHNLMVPVGSENNSGPCLHWMVLNFFKRQEYFHSFYFVAKLPVRWMKNRQYNHFAEESPLSIMLRLYSEKSTLDET